MATLVVSFLWKYFFCCSYQAEPHTRFKMADDRLLPTAKFPPDERRKYDATALQVRIIEHFVRTEALGEGVVRLFKRLQDLFKDTPHPGMRADKAHSDPAGIRSGATGKALLKEDQAYDANLRYTLNGITYQVPKQPTFRVVMDPSTNQPIPIRRNEPRLFLRQQYKLEFEAWKPRRLCPTRDQIADFYRRDATIQIDRQPRRNVAGGIRGPPKNIIMPFLPPSLLHTVFVDMMRLPLSGHPFLSTRMPASEF